MSEAIVLKEHPRAIRHVRLAKGWGGLVCFALAFLLSQRAGVTFAESAGRALVAGLAGMLVCWAAAIAVWRQLALAELDAARRRVLAAREAAAAEREAAAAAAAAESEVAA